jgi:hypothetical protein
MYPDTGEPAIVVDSALDPERTRQLYVEARAAEDGWQFFYYRMYRAREEELKRGPKLR